MKNIPLQEAQHKLPELVALVEQGEEIFILSDNKTRIKLVSCTHLPKKRVFGQHRGLATMREDFDGPLSDIFGLGA
jgi:antitoxin (DNA-binding transcriptional repressor) of toxin-antitoxin stability system